MTICEHLISSTLSLRIGYTAVRILDVLLCLNFKVLIQKICVRKSFNKTINESR